MSEPIKIVVTAETAQAAAALRSFVEQSNSGLKSMVPAAAAGASALTQARQASMLTHESFRTLSSTAYLLGGTRFPQLSMGVMGATQGLRALLAAAMLSGIGMAELLVPLAAIAAVVGAGAFVWHEFSASEADAATKAKDLEEALGKIPTLLEKINTLQKAGALGPGAAASYSDYITGKKKLYVQPDGSVGPQRTTTYTTPAHQVPLASGGWAQIPESTSTIDNPEASLAQAQKWGQEQLSGNAGLDDTRMKALADFKELQDRIQKEKLTGIEKEKEAVTDRYKKEFELASEQERAAGPMASPAKQKAFADAKLAIAANLNRELAALDQKAADEQVKCDEEALKQIQENQTKYSEWLKSQKEKDLKTVVEAEQQQRDALAEQKFAITSNPYLSEAQKAGPTEQILQQQIALAATEKERLGYERELANLEKSQTFAGQMQAMIIGWQNANNLIKDSVKLIDTAMNAAVNSISQNLTKIIEGTESWRQGLLKVADAMITNVLQAIIKIIAQLLVEESVEIVVRALALGFQSGGYTGAGAQDEVVGVVHGGEYVMPASAVDRIGVGNLAALHHGNASLSGGGMAAGGAQPYQHKTVICYDRQEFLKEMKSNDAREVTVAHVFANRQRLGIKT